MSTITIHDVSDELTEAMTAYAEANGISVDAYARELLSFAFAERNRGSMKLSEAFRLYFGPNNGVELDLSGRDSGREMIEFDESFD
jgi:plasmid stability protein